MTDHGELARLCLSCYPGGGAKVQEVEGVHFQIFDVDWFAIGASPKEWKVKAVVFPGTENFLDVLRDAEVRKVNFSKGRVHQGFLQAWNIARPEIYWQVPQGTPVVFSGHSLGGAIASVGALDFIDHRGSDVVEVVTWGCPRVGDRGFANEYKDRLGSRTARYVHALDPVPWLPPYRWGYRWTGSKPIWWNGSEWQKGFSFWHMLKMFFRSPESVKSDHAMQCYVDCFSDKYVGD